ncbi:MAG: hypothetical protein ACRDTJ_10475 [Pseudonocardiaceae bacterium]
MMEFFGWFTEPLGLGGHIVLWGCVLVAAAAVAAIVWMAFRAQIEDSAVADMSRRIVELARFPQAEKSGVRAEVDLAELIQWGSAAGAGVGEPDRGDLEDEPGAVILPFLPRAQRVARRGGWSA